MATFPEIRGSCFCGANQFAITEPAVDTHHCHCSICRRLQGAAFVTLSIFPKSAFDGPRVATSRDSEVKTKSIGIGVKIADPRSQSTSMQCRICSRSAAHASSQSRIPGIPLKHSGTLSGRIACPGSRSTTTSGSQRASTSSRNRRELDSSSLASHRCNTSIACIECYRSV